MNEETLNIFFDKLVLVLIRDLAIYFPSAIIPDNVRETLQQSLPKHFLDELYILDSQGMGDFEIGEINQRLKLKHNLLEQNIFKLLAKKKELAEDEFNYILTKYFEQVEFYSAITNWLSINLSLYNKDNIDFATIGAFTMQKEFYKAHFMELMQTFYATKEVKLKDLFNILELVTRYLPDFAARYGNGNLEVTIQTTVENKPPEEPTENTKPKTNKKPKKKPPVSELEAERFLLETVFNINPKIIKSVIP